jgi:aminopeptidase YwaD
MKRKLFALTVALFPVVMASSQLSNVVGKAGRYIVPAALRDPIVQEFSGEQAFLHVQMLSGTRDRQAEEYEGQFFETTYIRDEALRAGMSDVAVDFFPGRDTWDAIEGDLYLVQPEAKKIASLNQVPSSLASGSTDTDVEAEVVYVGAGREEDYAGKDVAGKIVLGGATTSTLFRRAVAGKGAVGVLGTGSAGVSADSAGYTLDQIGWASVSPAAGKGGFGFALSLRQFRELREYCEQGRKVVVRAHVRAKTYPGKMNVISAAIPGSDPAAGELLFVAHAFETISKPGANDNCTGVAVLLEAGRTMARLIRDKAIPVPRRTLRFVWGNEISGSTAWMFKHPELEDRLLAAMNFDMAGANMRTTDSYLRMKMTPDGRPSYLNALIADALRFVDQAEIRTVQGENAPFNYRMAPLAAITSGSDHSVFLAAGIPAMQFNYWPDNFYHSSADRIVHVDPTELKRAGVAALTAFAYLASAGGDEAAALAWEAAADGDRHLAEVARQCLRLFGEDPVKIHTRFGAIRDKIDGAFARAKGGVESVLTLGRTPVSEAMVAMLTTGLDQSRRNAFRRLEAVYRDRCRALKVKPEVPKLTDREKEYSRMVPRRKFKVYSAEAQKLNAQGRPSEPRANPGGQPPSKPGAAAASPAAPRPFGFVRTSTQYFIDGQRSILEIYRLVRAECGNLQVGSQEAKYAYVLGLEFPDVELETVADVIKGLERTGAVEIVEVPGRRAGR